MGGYNPKKNDITTFLDQVSKELDKLLSKYKNILLMGDFNSELSEEAMKIFCETYNLVNLINELTCYKVK